MNFRVVELDFPIPPGTDGDTIFARLERDLPDRLWLTDAIAPSWDSAKGTFRVTVFESGFEDRAGVVRLLADLGVAPVENEVWI